MAKPVVKPIDAETLADLNTGFHSLYEGAKAAVTTSYEQVAMTVPSSGKDEKYGWLGQFPRIREWVGDRIIHKLKSHGFSIENKDYESTISVKRNDIEDDNIGQYSPLFQQFGYDAAVFSDELVYGLLKIGFTTLCYDGQYFFDTDHPVLDESGNEISASNTGGGSGASWFLIDDSRPIKPLILQVRRPIDLVSLDDPKDENVFKRKEFVYGMDGRLAAGVGLWQLAYGSKQTLNDTNYNAARVNLATRKGDHGKVLGLKGSLLVVGPSNEAAARKLLEAENNAAGETNIWRNTAKLLVSPYLD